MVRASFGTRPNLTTTVSRLRTAVPRPRFLTVQNVPLVRGETITLSFPRHVDAPWVERQSERLEDRRVGRLVVDISKWERSRALAEARLLGLLTQARREDIEIEVRVGNLEDYRGPGGRSPRWRLLTTTLGGVLVGQLADRIVGGGRESEVLEHQRDALSRDDSTGFGKERAWIDLGVPGAPPPGRLVAGGGTPREFASVLRAAIANLTPLEPLPEFDLGEMIRFAWEAVDNIHRHATLALDRTRIRGPRFLLLRRLSLRSEVPAPSSIGADPVAHYLAEIARQVAAREARGDQLIEMTIADVGPGIAATLAQSAELSPDEELEWLLTALRPRTTSRRPPARGAGAGVGLLKAQQATSRVGGIMSVRTGSYELHRSSFDAPDDDGDWLTTRRRFAPGTSLSLVFPWAPARRARTGVPGRAGGER